MSKSKIFLRGIGCFLCIMLFCAGISLINFGASEKTAKADEPYTIHYYAISTAGEVFVGWDSDNDSNIDQFGDVELDKDARTVDAFTSAGAAHQVNCLPGVLVRPTIDPDMTTTLPTEFAGQIVDLTSYINGNVVDVQCGWMFEYFVGDTITLRSLKSATGANALPADFISSNYSPTATSTHEINLYCIVNPYTVTLDATELGNFGYETEHGENTPIPEVTTQIQYKDVKTDFVCPTPNNTAMWRFDGYFTEPTGGTRVTDRYGDMTNGDMTQGWTYNIPKIYAHYTHVFNVEYYYTLNNNTYRGEIQFDDNRTIYATDLNNDVYADTAYDINTSAALAFPTDKVVANWYTNNTFTQAASFPLKKQDIILYAKIANSQYDITFNANGGEFINDRGTTITYTMDYGKTLGDAITKLTGELGSNVPVATRRGYDCNNRNWAEEANSTTTLNRTTSFITQDREVFLIWSVRTYKIEYHTDGTLSKTTDNVTYHSDLWNVVSKVTPIRTGYNFVGWAYSTSSEANSYTIETRPTNKEFDFNTTTSLTLIRNETIESNRELMPDQNISLYGVWIQAYTLKFNLNQGEIPNVATTPLVLGADKKTINITIENGETLGQALIRQEISDFFTNTKYQPVLSSCKFVGWYYYVDGDFSNNQVGNSTQLDGSLTALNVNELKSRNIDVTKDSTIAAKFSFDTNTTTYATPPEETANTFFAIVLMVISVILLVMLIMSHHNSSKIEINDKAIDAYKEIYGEDAPLPTFESTRPPFEIEDDAPVQKQEDKKPE